MPSNVEIKARVRDPDALARTVERLAGPAEAVLIQEDVFFCTGRGRLKLRIFGDGSGELIFYRRSDRAGPKESRFAKAPVADPSALRSVLIGALGTAGTVRKRRVLHRIGRTRVHLDEVEDLGHFLELEVMLADGEAAAEGETVARDLMAELGVTEDDLIDVAYVDLLERRVE